MISEESRMFASALIILYVLIMILDSITVNFIIKDRDRYAYTCMYIPVFLILSVCIIYITYISDI